jgi:hypothetical protein
MAGSLNHIVGEDGRFRMESIENLGDAHEALEECFKIILELTGGKKAKVNRVLRKLNFPEIETDMKPGGEDAKWNE